MTRLPEVISTVQRRRAWSLEEKIEILDAAFSKGGSVAAAADRFGVSRSLIYIWRSRVRDGALPGVSMTVAGVSAFAPVAVMSEPGTSPPPACSVLADKPCPERRRSSVIEVRLVNGRMVKADENIAPDVLARLVGALDGDQS